AIHRQACLLCQCETWPHANTHHDEIGLQHGPTLERCIRAIDCRDGVFEMEHDTVLLVERTNEVTELAAEYAFKRPLLGRHHVNLYLSPTQRRGRFEPDEARADHDCVPCPFRLSNNGARVRQ